MAMRGEMFEQIVIERIIQLIEEPEVHREKRIQATCRAHGKNFRSIIVLNYFVYCAAAEQLLQLFMNA